MFTIPSNADAFSPNPQSIWMEADIRALEMALGGEGVVSGCAVTEQSPAALAVDVASGTVRIGGSEVAVSSGSVSLAAADPSDERVDLIVVDNGGTLSDVTGTPAPVTDTSGPEAPDIPASSVLLAMVLVPAGATTVTTVHITDKRLTPAVGEGDVEGPASSVDGRIALFDGTTGKLLKQAGEGILSTVGQAEAEAGTATTRRIWTAERVKQAIDALAGGGRTILLPVSGAELDSSSGPQAELGGERLRLRFDDTTDEICRWTFQMPDHYAGETLTLRGTYSMVSATSGSVVLQCNVWALSGGDAADADTESYATDNSVQKTVPATAGHAQGFEITVNNDDGIAAGDLVTLALRRDADGTNATDDASGDLELRSLALEWS